GVRLGNDGAGRGPRLSVRHRLAGPRSHALGRPARRTAMKLLPTASQTVGPFLHIGLGWLTVDRVAAPDCPGRHLTLGGRVLDGDGRPVTDALVEIWQADANGRYAHPEDRGEGGFRGFGRVPTDAAGRYRFFTIKPGPVADPRGGLQAPHLMVSLFMRG